MGKRDLSRRVDELEDDANDDEEKDPVEQWRAFLRGEPSPWNDLITNDK